MTRRLQQFVRGTPISEIRGSLNRIVDAVNEINAPVSGSTPTRNATPLLLLLEIRILNANTLTCAFPGQQLNPAAQTWEVKLPPTFTETSRDGVSYVYTDINNRTADGAEAQKLTPIYLVQDLILVQQISYTGELYDLNIDGRQWARVP